MFKLKRLAIICVVFLCFCPRAWSQTPSQLMLSNNYFVTGDYVVGGIGLRGLGINGIATEQSTFPIKRRPQRPA